MKGLEALKSIKSHNYSKASKKECIATIEKDLKALEEIITLYNKWLGNEMSDFEFFTKLNEIINTNY